MNRAPWLAAALLLAAAPAAPAQDPDPTVESVLPSSGPTAGGTTVTITGTGFTDPMTVTFGGTPVPAVTFVSATEIQATTPPHARGPADVVVTRTAPPPPASSAPGAASFTFVPPPCRLWVPRAPGSATGGNPGGLDVTIVDGANRVVEASLDLNAADALLPTDDDWRVTQVLFHPSGDWAYLATAGTPGRLDSRRIFVVKTALALGAEEGNPIVASIDTLGNPYQIALSADHGTLFVADGGSWKGSAVLLPNGSFRAYDVTDPAAPAIRGAPLTVGILPVLTFDSSAYRRWGTNASFPGLVQSRNGLCVVTNAGSHTLTVVDLADLSAADPLDAGVPEGETIQASVSIPSPFADDLVFVQTTDFTLAPPSSFAPKDTAYSILRVSAGALLPRGLVTLPMRFFQAIPSLDLQNRQAWPHPDGQSLVAVPASGASVVAWNPATGSAGARATIPGTGPPSSLAFNDTTGLFYARRNTGGWTVLSVATDRGAAPVAVAQVEDAAGVNSLRVFGDGSELAGTGTSSLAVVDGNPASPTAHQVAATVALPLDPAGGAVHPQPDPACGPARTFVAILPPPEGPRIVVPIPGTGVCSGEDPPEFVFDADGEPPGGFELELGTQPDFLTGPGAARVVVRVPRGSLTVTPSRRSWLRVLRAAAGDGVRPLYARVNARIPLGERVQGGVLAVDVCESQAPEPLDPPDGATATPDDPPEFSFLPPERGRYSIEIRGGPEDRVLARLPVGVSVSPGVAVAVFPSARTWRKVVAGAAGEDVSWSVRFVDALGRGVFSESRRIVLGD